MYKSTKVQIRNHANIQKHESAKVRMYISTNTLMYKSTNAQYIFCTIYLQTNRNINIKFNIDK